ELCQRRRCDNNRQCRARRSAKDVSVIRDANNAGANEQQGHFCLQDYSNDQTNARNSPLQPVLHSKLREPVTGMEDQGDDCGAYTVEDRGDGLQITEVYVKRAQCSDDDEVWQDECPSTRPGTPKTSTEIRHVNPDLDRERSRKRLTDGDGFAHLFF